MAANEMLDGHRTGRIDIVVPVYNEGEVIGCFFDRICEQRQLLGSRIRLIFVDDGSSDETPRHCEELSHKYDWVGYIRLSRNFGHQHALTAGLDLADGDAVLTMDGDLEHPPEMIPTMVRLWEQGYDVVSCRRERAESLSIFKRVTSKVFYSILRKISDLSEIEEVPDFRLLDRKVVLALRRIREQTRFIRGFCAWVGYRQITIPYQQGTRPGGKSKYSVLKMVRLALGALLGFSRLPLRIATMIGVSVAGMSSAYGIYAVVQKVVFERSVPGWASMAALVSFLSAMQLVVLGIIGEYLGQTLEESKRRPLYLIDECFLPQMDENGCHVERSRDDG